MKSTSITFFKKALLAAVSSVALSSAFASTIDATTDVKVSGRVQSVNVQERSVTVLDAQGRNETFKVGANVPNLGQLKPGTEVFGMTQRALRLTVFDSSSQAAVPSASGAQIAARVTGVDVPNSLIGLTDTQGASLTVHANSPGAMGAVVPGSRVLVDVVSGTDVHSATAIQ